MDFLSGQQIRCDDGVVLDMLLDPPIVIVQATRQAVRRWRLRNIVRISPHLIPQEPDFEVPHDRSRETPQRLDTFVLDFPESIDYLLCGENPAVVPFSNAGTTSSAPV